MLAQREKLYRCTYSPTSGADGRLAHVAAWDEGEALQLFQEELRGEGVEEQGTIEVAPLGGKTRGRQAPYRPTRH